MIDNAHRTSYDRQSPVIWPDPSPLDSWWDAVMRGEDLTKPSRVKSARP
ncbi:hypothetical protein [Nocardia aurantiaca]|uniref:Uncharacterized protein n=1 Tax=Nocardia aurantiaca TaxID=2675850 RepID=A0A6I3L5P5_9NOCA|nr:hypothetical protein [Nocardia aurantiaca]MTE15855.1 hypothetical protein [Nocardia aurantiaca]